MPQRHRCIIVDDEPDAIELLSSRITKLYTNVHIVATYSNWQDALSALRTTQYDLLMMDISMPGKTGINLLKLIPGIDCEIIFVTAHDNYAIDAFELSASGYILKPIDDEELSQAVDKAIERIVYKKQANMLSGNNIPQTQLKGGKIAVPGNQGIDYINISDILYLESTNKCTKITTATDEYLSTSNIGRFQYLIENHSFFHIHRSFIINVKCVLRYDVRGYIIMADKKEIPISRVAKADFLRMFNLDQ